MSINRQDFILPGLPNKPDPVKRLWILTLILVITIIALGITGYIYFKHARTTSTEIPSNAAQVTSNISIKENLGKTSNLKGKYCYAGEPRITTYPHPLLVLTNLGYIAAYDESRKDPAWVCYRLNKVASLIAPPRPQSFSTDARTKAKVKSADYTGTGYDRGHMAPNYGIAVCYQGQAQLETFLMSNIIPQKPNLNRKVWEHLEEREIKTYAQNFGTVWIITGPVFDKQPARLSSGIAVPAKCFKIIIREENGQQKVLAFEMPQDVTGNEQLNKFLTSVRDVEANTGLDFLNELPDDVEGRIETEKPVAMW